MLVSSSKHAWKLCMGHTLHCIDACVIKHACLKALHIVVACICLHSAELLTFSGHKINIRKSNNCEIHFRFISNKAFRHVEILYKNLFTIYIVKEFCEWTGVNFFDYVNSKEVFVQKFLHVEMPYCYLEISQAFFSQKLFHVSKFSSLYNFSLLSNMSSLFHIVGIQKKYYNGLYQVKLLIFKFSCIKTWTTFFQIKNLSFFDQRLKLSSLSSKFKNRVIN